ncbi:hypothetical protein ACLB2K_012141 [Fragaria x ananassa]
MSVRSPPSGAGNDAPPPQKTPAASPTTSAPRDCTDNSPSLPGRTPDLDHELPLAGGLTEYQLAAEIDVV